MAENQTFLLCVDRNRADSRENSRPLRRSFILRVAEGMLRPDSATNANIGEKFANQNETIRVHSVRPRVDASRRFLYDELLGRLAQRLERSVYTRKVVRSNRTVPTIVTHHPSAGT